MVQSHLAFLLQFSKVSLHDIFLFVFRVFIFLILTEEKKHPCNFFLFDYMPGGRGLSGVAATLVGGLADGAATLAGGLADGSATRGLAAPGG